MRIRSVHLKNYRCCKTVSVEFDELTAFVGKNGAGKSTIMQAIKYFFSPDAELLKEDFYNETIIDNKVEIKVTFDKPRLP